MTEQKNNIWTYIRQKITKGEEISPFLFVSKNITEAETYSQSLALELCAEYGVDKNFIFHLQSVEDESLKIEQVRDFLQLTNRKSSFLFQIFIIHDISRLTLQSANAMLKFLEEPGVGNIVFLTNQGEGGVLDTILSRVQVYPLWDTQKRLYSEQMYQMIESLITEKDPEIFSYFYGAEVTRGLAWEFLYTLLEVGKHHHLSDSVFQELEEDITGLEKNNLLPKYIVDKYLAFLS